jgi:hypothetical protein
MGQKPTKEELMEMHHERLQETLESLAMRQVQVERQEKNIHKQLDAAKAERNVARFEALAGSLLSVRSTLAILGNAIRGISQVRAEVAVSQATMASLQDINALTRLTTGVENVNQINQLVQEYRTSIRDLSVQTTMLNSAFDASSSGSNTLSEEHKAAVADMVEKMKDELDLETETNMPNIAHKHGVSKVVAEGTSEQQLEDRVRKLNV